jgi:nitroreductase
MEVSEAIRRRVSVEEFDPDATLSDAEIVSLVQAACHAPSSFNIQHWRFVAVRTAEGKRRLREVAFGQRHVAEAAVTFIVLGDLQGADALPEVMDLAVERGTLPAGKAAAWVRMAREIYADPQTARDEAMRSASLAAMVLMLAAEERGLASGAISGFDADKLRREFAISERYVPAMLLAVGPASSTRPARQPRLAVDRVLAFDDASGL